MTIFDTHCHYNLPPLSDNWRQHWQTAQQHGVTKSVIVGTSLATSKLAVEIASSDLNLFAAIGLHPNDLEELADGELPQHMAELAKLGHHSSVVAVGETGLDYFRLTPDQKDRVKDLQKESLVLHIKLASALKKPLILHVRDHDLPEVPTPDIAYWDILEILATHRPADLPIILHCVSGPLAYVQAAVKLGAYIGIAGNSTYPSADHIRRLIQAVPNDKLLLETDAPFLPPQPHRGQPCEPWMIALTAEYLTQELGLDINQLTANASRLLH